MWWPDAAVLAMPLRRRLLVTGGDRAPSPSLRSCDLAGAGCGGGGGRSAPTGRGHVARSRRCPATIIATALSLLMEPPPPPPLARRQAHPCEPGLPTDAPYLCARGVCVCLPFPAVCLVLSVAAAFPPPQLPPCSFLPPPPSPRDSTGVPEAYAWGLTQLGVVRRQAAISRMYAPPPTVLEGTPAAGPPPAPAAGGA